MNKTKQTAAAVIASAMMAVPHAADAQIVPDKVPLYTYAEAQTPVFAGVNGKKTGTIRLKGDAAEAIKLKVGTGKVQTLFWYNTINNKTKK